MDGPGQQQQSRCSARVAADLMQRARMSAVTICGQDAHAVAVARALLNLRPSVSLISLALDGRPSSDKLMFVGTDAAQHKLEHCAFLRFSPAGRVIAALLVPNASWQVRGTPADTVCWRDTVGGSGSTQFDDQGDFATYVRTISAMRGDDAWARA